MSPPAARSVAITMNVGYVCLVVRLCVVDLSRSANFTDSFLLLSSLWDFVLSGSIVVGLGHKTNLVSTNLLEGLNFANGLKERRHLSTSGFSPQLYQQMSCLAQLASRRIGTTRHFLAIPPIHYEFFEHCALFV